MVWYASIPIGGLSPPPLSPLLVHVHTPAASSLALVLPPWPLFVPPGPHLYSPAALLIHGSFHLTCPQFVLVCSCLCLLLLFLLQLPLCIPVPLHWPLVHVHPPSSVCSTIPVKAKLVFFKRKFTSGYPWSNPIRLNNFSYELSLISIFLDGLPGTIVLPQDNLYLPLDHSWDGPFGGSQDG